MALERLENQGKEAPYPALSRWLGVLVFLGQLVALYHALNHTSDTPNILGRYSTSYAMGLAGVVVLSLFWLGAFWQRHTCVAWLNKRTALARLLLIAGVFIALGLTLVFMGFLNPKIIVAFSIHALLFVLMIVVTLHDATVPSRWSIVALITICVLYVVFWAISITQYVVFSPDEAHWAAIAGNYLYEGNIYGRMLYEPVHAITPGVGYLNWVYALLIDTFGWDIRVGRYLQLIAYLVGIVGIGVATYTLKKSLFASLTSATVALFSQSFLPVLDYRPDHFVMPIAVWAVAFALIGFSASRRVWLWHGVAGFTVLLTLQAHAIGICIIVSLSVYYGVRGVIALYQRDMRQFLPLLGYVTGAGVGSASYIWLNIIAVGGLAEYWAYLGGFSDSFRYFPVFYFAPVEATLIGAGMVWLAMTQRRMAKDYLIIMMLLVISILLLDTRSYIVPYQGLFFIPTGLLLASIVRLPHQRNLFLIVIASFFMIMRITFINWEAVGHFLTTGQLYEHPMAFISREVATYIQPDDVVVGTHELVWGLGNQPHFYSLLSEGMSTSFRGYASNTQAWEEIQPNTVIELSKSLIISSGLRAYMQENGFQPCETFTVSDRVVQFYRITCDKPSNEN